MKKNLFNFFYQNYYLTLNQWINFLFLLIHFGLTSLTTWIYIYNIRNNDIGILWITNAIGIIFITNALYLKDNINDKILNKSDHSDNSQDKIIKYNLKLALLNTIIFLSSYLLIRILIFPINKLLLIFLTLSNLVEVLLTIYLLDFIKLNVFSLIDNSIKAYKIILVQFISCFVSSNIAVIGIVIFDGNNLDYLRNFLSWFLNNLSGLLNILFCVNIFYNYKELNSSNQINNKYYYEIVQSIIILILISLLNFKQYTDDFFVFPSIFFVISLIIFISLLTNQVIAIVTSLLTNLILYISEFYKLGPVYFVISLARDEDVILDTAVAIQTLTIIIIIICIYITTLIKENSDKNQKLLYSLKERIHFFENLSHNLKTPLSIIQGTSEQIIYEKENKLSTSNVSESDITTILNSTVYIIRYIDDLLDLFKLNTESLKIVYKPDTIYNICNLHKARILSLVKNKNLELSINLSENCKYPILIDEYRLCQIVNHLLENAVKYTERGQIIFNMNLTGKYIPYNKTTLIIEVIDTGIGLTKKEIKNITKEFYRSENVKTVGTGLGLSIVENILNNINGKLIIESDGLNKGSKFTVIINTEYTIISELKNEVKSCILENINQKNLKILIVEDSFLNFQILNRLIESLYSNIKCINAECCSVAYKLLNEEIFDIIFLDIGLPDGFGLDIKKYIENKLSINNPNIPIVLITASVLSSIDNNIKETEKLYFCFKPFSRKSVSNVLSKILINLNNINDII
jgi:signal transduction histidine kinase